MNKEVWLVCEAIPYEGGFISDYDNENEARLKWNSLIKGYEDNKDNSYPEFIAKCELIEWYNK